MSLLLAIFFSLTFVLSLGDVKEGADEKIKLIQEECAKANGLSSEELKMFDTADDDDDDDDDDEEEEDSSSSSDNKSKKSSENSSSDDDNEDDDENVEKYICYIKCYFTKLELLDENGNINVNKSNVLLEDDEAIDEIRHTKIIECLKSIDKIEKCSDVNKIFECIEVSSN